MTLYDVGSSALSPIEPYLNAWLPPSPKSASILWRGKYAHRRSTAGCRLALLDLVLSVSATAAFPRYLPSTSLKVGISVDMFAKCYEYLVVGRKRLQW